MSTRVILYAFIGMMIFNLILYLICEVKRLRKLLNRQGICPDCNRSYMNCVCFKK